MKLSLYQIWYDENTKPDENSGLLAFDCRDNPEFLKREIAHLINFYDAIVKDADRDDYFALLSPRFSEKTGLTIAQVKDFVTTNPSNDIFLFNPFPMHVYLNMNVWDNGESQHKGLKELTQYLFNTAGVDFDVYAMHRNTIYNTVYCNYWVASKVFLDNFIGFIKKLDTTIENMTDSDKNKYFSDANYHTKASFYPFIFERLICTFLLMNDSYKVKPFIYDENAIMVKNTKKIDRFFYIEGYRKDFDEWEKLNKGSIFILFEGQKLVKNLLRPNTNIYPFKFLNKFSDSIIKKKNIYKINSKGITNLLENL